LHQNLILDTIDKNLGYEIQQEVQVQWCRVQVKKKFYLKKKKKKKVLQGNIINGTMT
jgi:hypothetical protein